MSYWQILQVVPESMKVTRIGVVGDAVAVHLWRHSYHRLPTLIGKHGIGGEFDPPVEVFAGETLYAHVGPTFRDGPPLLYFEPLQDDAWHARQAARELARRLAAQADALDRALWEAGCPS